MKSKKECKVCSIMFTPRNQNSKFCSVECSKINQKIEHQKNKIIESKEKYPDGTDPDSFVGCSFCSLRSPDIATHIKIHGISSKEYKEKYGSTKCKNTIDKMLGSNNPAYQHGGSLSPYSKNFIYYTTDEAISDLAKRASKTAKDNDNNPLTIEYYIKRGMSIEEAKIALRKRQTTFSLDICIEKYGKEEGTKVWQDRQDTWQGTLNSKPQEEIDEINKKKSTKTDYSSLWNQGLDVDGYFYIIKLDENTCKIGVTTKDSIEQRYNRKDLRNTEVLMFEKAESINHAFHIEQVLKYSNKDSIIRNDYGVFG